MTATEPSKTAEADHRHRAEVGGAVNPLDQVTRQNAAFVEEREAAAESLKQRAATLAELVSVFEIAGVSAAAAVGFKAKGTPKPGAKSSRAQASAHEALDGCGSRRNERRRTGDVLNLLRRQRRPCPHSKESPDDHCH